MLCVSIPSLAICDFVSDCFELLVYACKNSERNIDFYSFSESQFTSFMIFTTLNTLFSSENL